MHLVKAFEETNLSFYFNALRKYFYQTQELVYTRKVSTPLSVLGHIKCMLLALLVFAVYYPDWLAINSLH